MKLRVALLYGVLAVSLMGTLGAAGYAFPQDRAGAALPQDEEKLFQYAQDRLNHGDWIQAEKGFKAWLEKFPDGTRAETVYGQLANLYQWHGRKPAEARAWLARFGPATVADLRFAKPLDEELIRRLLTTHEVAVTIEEASIGGLGAHVLTFASDEGLIDAGLKVRTMRLPDKFIDQDKPEKQYDEAGLNAPQIVDTVLKALRVNSAAVEEVRA